MERAGFTAPFPATRRRIGAGVCVGGAVFPNARPRAGSGGRLVPFLGCRGFLLARTGGCADAESVRSG